MSRNILKFQVYSRYFSTLPKQVVVDTLTKQTSAPKKRTVQAKINQEHIFGRKYIIRKLQEVLGVSAFAAVGILNSNKALCLLNGKMMAQRFEILKAAGLTTDIILNYPSLLTTNDLERKLEISKRLTDNIAEVAPLLTLKIQDLENMIQKARSTNRLQLLSDLLQMSKTQFCGELLKKPFLKTVSVEKVKANLDLLLSNGVTIEEIHRDLWVLSYKTEVIKARLELATTMRVEVKTWMARCKPEILDRYVTRRTDKKQILGDNSLAEYLSERLDCSVEEAKVLMNKQPALQNKSMKKMKEILDFLFAEGFKPSQICRVPKILLHSVETTKQRLKELEPYGKHLDSLYLLTKSKKQYMQHLEALIKTSNKAKSSN